MRKTIESINKQTFKNFEVWVMDGESDLKTQEFLKELEAPFFYQSKKDNGIYDAMNAGITLSKGDWLYFLGAEDVFFNEGILEQIFSNSSLNNETIIAGKIIYEGDTKPFIHSKKKVVKDVYWSRCMWVRNGLHHQGTFYKNELFENKKYDLNYKTLADYWFNLYLFKSKEKCKIFDFIIAKCNSDGISKSGNWEMYREEINLKTNLSSVIYIPFFYTIAFFKFMSRKMVNAE